MIDMLHRFSMDHYHRMGDAGIFGREQRVELIRGRIVDIPAQDVAHVAMTITLTHLLTAAAGDRGLIPVRNPLRLDRWSEPQPDIAMLGPGAAEPDAPMALPGVALAASDIWGIRSN